MLSTACPARRGCGWRATGLRPCACAPPGNRSGPRSDSWSRIEWLGTITEEEKIARLKGADIFCAPSLRGESFGIVLLEAMAVGTAVVAGDLPGYRSVAVDGVNALLVPPGDAGALAAAIGSLLAEPRRAARLVAEGRRHVESFSMDSLANHYLERYRRIVGPVTPGSGPTRGHRTRDGGQQPASGTGPALLKRMPT